MTILEYLNDTYKSESEWTIIDFWENEFWKYIILDKTIFYPQWWWQPSDVWEIKISWKNFFVEKVKMDENGNVYHYWKTDFSFDKWEKVDLFFDKDKRIFNARNHSAWHLLDVAMTRLWFSNLLPTKWHHFPDWSYVQYEWDFSENIDDFINKLNKKLDELTSLDLKVIISYGDLAIKSPIWKTPRYVNFEWEKWCWCWWTHINFSKEIWKINIRKVSYKWNVLKISYELN